MKPMKLMLGTMILGLGIAGTALAQPAPSHDRDADVHGGYTTDRDDAYRARGDQDDRAVWRGDRDDVYRGWYNPYVYRRGDGDRDRDDGNVWRGDHGARRSWNWGHSHMRRGKWDDR
jgi:hypothetical protein